MGRPAPARRGCRRRAPTQVRALCWSRDSGPGVRWCPPPPDRGTASPCFPPPPRSFPLGWPGPPGVMQPEGAGTGLPGPPTPGRRCCCGSGWAVLDGLVHPGPSSKGKQTQRVTGPTQQQRHPLGEAVSFPCLSVNGPAPVYPSSFHPLLKAGGCGQGMNLKIKPCSNAV